MASELENLWDPSSAMQEHNKIITYKSRNNIVKKLQKALIRNPLLSWFEGLR